MICWIASFPRSGNTLTRQILRDSFDIETYTCYTSTDLDHLFPNQHKYDLSDYETYCSLAQSEETYFIKTHEARFDGQPAIWIVRNGRDAISSLAKMWDIPVYDTIVMQNNLPNWSAHFWSYYGRLNCLMLRFEDLVADPGAQSQRIGEFIKKTPKPYRNAFEPVNPAMGSGGNHKASLDHGEERLFKNIHGVVMGVLGYD